jgi:dTDP-4-dehydrorhamnose reductase
VKALIIGANGQLGSDLVKALADWQVIPAKHADIDVCDPALTQRRLAEVRPEVVINTAAFHRVEDCEEQPEKAFAVNSLAVRNLARFCAELPCTLVHLSTDYVFDGQKQSPYAEADSPNPLNAYGVSKLAGEYFVRTLCPRHFVIRTSGLYGEAGSSGKGGNFVELMIRLAKEGKPIKVVKDQVLTPTNTKDLASKIRELLPTGRFGLYHLTNSSACSWYEFARKIFEVTTLRPSLEPVSTASFGSRVRRPAYSVLAHDRLLQTGLADLRPWPEALASYLRDKRHI